jgi:hypothetical protein
MQIDKTIDQRIDQLLTLKLRAWEAGFLYGSRGHFCPSCEQIAKLDWIHATRFNSSSNFNPNTTYERSTTAVR